VYDESPGCLDHCDSIDPGPGWNFLNNAGFNSIETRLTTIKGDLRQFYRDLGRHDADIASLKDQRRS